MNLGDIINSGINNPVAKGPISSGIVNHILGTKTAPITPTLKGLGAKGPITEPSSPTPPKPVTTTGNKLSNKLNLSSLHIPTQQNLGQPQSNLSVGIQQSDIPQSDVATVANTAIDAIISGYKGKKKALEQALPEQTKSLDKYAKVLDEVNQNIKKMPTIPIMKSYQEITQHTREIFPLLSGVLALGFAIFGKGSLSHRLDSFGEDYAAMAQGLQQYNLKQFAIATQNWQNKVKEWEATTKQSLQKYNEYLQAAMTGVGIAKAKASLLQQIPELNVQTGQQLASLLNGLSMINYRIEGLKLRMAEIQMMMGKTIAQENYYRTSAEERQAITNKLAQEDLTQPQLRVAHQMDTWQSVADKLYGNIQKGNPPSIETINYYQQQGMPASLANDLKAAITKGAGLGHIGRLNQ